MKLSQEFKLDTRKKDGLLVDEKNARLKVEETLQSCLERLEETENKLKRVETASMDNRKALGKYSNDKKAWSLNKHYINRDILSGDSRPLKCC